MMNKRVVYLILMLGFFLQPVYSQELKNGAELQEQLSKTDKQIDALKEIGKRMIFGKTYEVRRNANHKFIKQLTHLLKSENSYEISLDELSFVSVQKPEDNAFRIFTWQIETVPGLIRHYGAIQLNQPQLSLIPLTDRSDDMEYPELAFGNQTNWFGAIYYRVQSVKKNGKTTYFLYGFDDHNPVSNKKVIEVMQFYGENSVMFGLPIFPDKIRKGELTNRFVLEYREDAAMRLNYSPKLKKIVFDHLSPMTEASEGIFAEYVPDGTFDALVMKNGLFYLEENIVSTSNEQLENKSDTPKSNTIYKSKSKEK